MNNEFCYQKKKRDWIVLLESQTEGTAKCKFILLRALIGRRRLRDRPATRIKMYSLVQNCPCAGVQSLWTHGESPGGCSGSGLVPSAGRGGAATALRPSAAARWGPAEPRVWALHLPAVLDLFALRCAAYQGQRSAAKVILPSHS